MMLCDFAAIVTWILQCLLIFPILTAACLAIPAVWSLSRLIPEDFGCRARAAAITDLIDGWLARKPVSQQPLAHF